MKSFLKIIIISVIISSISYAYFTKTQLQVFRIISAVSLLAFYGIVFYRFILYIKKIKIFQNKFLVYYTILVLLLLIPSFSFNKDDLITLFFHPIAFSAYFICVIVFFINEKSINIINKISRFFIYLIPILTVIEVVTLKSTPTLILCYTAYFFAYLFANKKTRFFIVLSMLGALYLFLIYDYRSGLLLVFCFLIFLSFSKLLIFLKSKRIRKIILFCTIVAGGYLFFNFTAFYNVLPISSDIIDTTDTRSFLFLEFFQEIKGNDLLFGRGYLGTYYSNYFYNWSGDNGDHYIRSVVEVGFLQFILKGGILLALAFLIVSLKSIYTNFIYSKINEWSYIAAGWLLIEILLLTVENVPSFNVHYLYIWILIGLLYPNKRKKLNLINERKP